MDRKYLLCKKGSKDCDYSIGCGMVYDIVEGKGKNMEEDMQLIFDEVAYPEGRNKYLNLDIDYKIDEVFVIPIDNNIYYMDIKKYKTEYKEIQKRKRDEASLLKEKEEYERLRRKFEK